MAPQFAWRLALIGFLATIVRGQILSVGFDATLRAALVSLIVVYGLGLWSGALWRAARE